MAFPPNRELAWLIEYASRKTPLQLHDLSYLATCNYISYRLAQFQTRNWPLIPLPCPHGPISICRATFNQRSDDRLAVKASDISPCARHSPLV